jgi:excisionase family DNA binding protein
VDGKGTALKEKGDHGMGKRLRIKTVAARLDCSPSYVYRLIDQGKLAAIRVGERMGLRIEESDLLAYEALKRTQRT